MKNNKIIIKDNIIQGKIENKKGSLNHRTKKIIKNYYASRNKKQHNFEKSTNDFNR